MHYIDLQSQMELFANSSCEELQDALISSIYTARYILAGVSHLVDVKNQGSLAPRTELLELLTDKLDHLSLIDWTWRDSFSRSLYGNKRRMPIDIETLEWCIPKANMRALPKFEYTL